MHKKYQVFISSTFDDLKGARHAVSNALLRADCFPAGMELFPAADEEQFQFIRRVIDQSDYYLVISAGKYGSIHPSTGISFTEMEYDYAVETGKPVLRLLHSDPLSMLPRELIETSDSGRVKLLNFHAKLKSSRLVQFWDTPEQLQIEALYALQQAQKMFPVPGWIRGDDQTIRKLREELEELKTASTKAKPLVSEEANLTTDSLQRVIGRSRQDGCDVSMITLILSLKKQFRQSPSVFIENVNEMLESIGFPEGATQFVMDALLEDGILKQRTTGEVLVLDKGQRLFRKTALEQFYDT